SVFIEGGSEVNGSAVSSGMVDKFLFFIAPKIIGGRGAPGPIGGGGIEVVTDSLQLEISSIEKIADDIVVEAYPSKRL
nr:dihydrofolate reductase family protein [Candidatus Methanofastidiosa archaeon]